MPYHFSIPTLAEDLQGPGECLIYLDRFFPHL